MGDRCKADGEDSIVGRIENNAERERLAELEYEMALRLEESSVITVPMSVASFSSQRNHNSPTKTATSSRSSDVSSREPNEEIRPNSSASKKSHRRDSGEAKQNASTRESRRTMSAPRTEAKEPPQEINTRAASQRNQTQRQQKGKHDHVSDDFSRVRKAFDPPSSSSARRREQSSREDPPTSDKRGGIQAERVTQESPSQYGSKLGIIDEEESWEDSDEDLNQHEEDAAGATASQRLLSPNGRSLPRINSFRSDDQSDVCSVYCASENSDEDYAAEAAQQSYVHECPPRDDYLSLDIESDDESDIDEELAPGPGAPQASRCMANNEEDDSSSGDYDTDEDENEAMYRESGDVYGRERVATGVQFEPQSVYGVSVSERLQKLRETDTAFAVREHNERLYRRRALYCCVVLLAVVLVGATTVGVGLVTTGAIGGGDGSSTDEEAQESFLPDDNDGATSPTDVDVDDDIDVDINSVLYTGVPTEDAITNTPTLAPTYEPSIRTTSQSPTRYPTDRISPTTYPSMLPSTTSSHPSYVPSSLPSISIRSTGPTYAPTGSLAPTPHIVYCPPAHMGYKATKGCRGFVYCAGGVAGGTVTTCSTGLLFDEKLGVCNWENLVDCPTFPPTVAPSPIPSAAQSDMPSESPSTLRITESPTNISAVPSNSPTIPRDASSAPSVMYASHMPSTRPTVIFSPNDFYCGTKSYTTNWNILVSFGDCSHDCPGGTDAECPEGMECFKASVCVEPAPTTQPTTSPTKPPTMSPVARISLAPSSIEVPTKEPTANVAINISAAPSSTSTVTPTKEPTADIMINISAAPSSASTETPTEDPTAKVLTDISATFYCGISWDDAVETCGASCPSGKDSDCPPGNLCYAFTPCT